jgi:hypothetical protein
MFYFCHIIASKNNNILQQLPHNDSAFVYIWTLDNDLINFVYINYAPTLNIAEK